MREILQTRNTLVFAGLIAITIISWFMGLESASGLFGTRVDGVILLLLAFFKVRLVMLHFMEIKHAPPLLRTICEAWIAISCGSLIAIYLGYL
jgi:hypothetical protein